MKELIILILVLSVLAVYQLEQDLDRIEQQQHQLELAVGRLELALKSVLGEN